MRHLISNEHWGDFKEPRRMASNINRSSLKLYRMVGLNLKYRFIFKAVFTTTRVRSTVVGICRVTPFKWPITCHIRRHLHPYVTTNPLALRRQRKQIAFNVVSRPTKDGSVSSADKIQRSHGRGRRCCKTFYIKRLSARLGFGISYSVCDIEKPVIIDKSVYGGRSSMLSS